MDFIVRFVQGYGYLPILIVDGEEVYRGEFKKSPQQAFESVMARVDKIYEQHCA